MWVMLMIWKPVKGYEDRYEISNTGVVRSLGSHHIYGNTIRTNPPKIMTIDPKGRVKLNRGGKQTTFSVKKLLIEHFGEIEIEVDGASNPSSRVE